MNKALTDDSTQTGRGGAIYNAKIGTITFNAGLTANENRGEVRTIGELYHGIFRSCTFFFCHQTFVVDGSLQLATSSPMSEGPGPACIGSELFDRYLQIGLTPRSVLEATVTPRIDATQIHQHRRG